MFYRVAATVLPYLQSRMCSASNSILFRQRFPINVINLSENITHHFPGPERCGLTKLDHVSLIGALCQPSRVSSTLFFSSARQQAHVISTAIWMSQSISGKNKPRSFHRHQSRLSTIHDSEGVIDVALTEFVDPTWRIGSSPKTPWVGRFRWVIILIILIILCWRQFNVNEVDATFSLSL